MLVLKYSKTLQYVLFQAMLFLLFSCSGPENEKYLENIEEIIRENPDSAYYLLVDADTSGYTVKEKNDYRLLEVIARDKNDMDISAASVHDLARYYEDTGDYGKAALSSFYSGKIYKANSMYKDALKAYYYVELLAGKLPDKEIAGKSLINAGSINYSQDIFPEAINDYKKSLLYIPVTNEYYTHVLLSIGNSYLLSFYESGTYSLYDSAFLYHGKALQHSKKTDHNLYTDVLKDIGFSHFIIDDFDTSLKYFNQALSLMTDSVAISGLYLGLARVYLEKQEFDTVDRYISRAERILSRDPENRVILYEFLYQFNEATGNREKASEYYRLYTTLLMDIKDKTKDASLIEIRKRYKERIMQLDMENQRMKYTLVIIAILFVIVSFSVYSFRKIRKKNREIRNVHKKVKHLERISENYLKALETKQTEEESYRSLLNEYAGILKDIAVYDNIFIEKNRDKIISKVQKMVYNEDSKFNWDKLYITLNVLHKEQFDKLIHISDRKRELDELGFKICCLGISGFSQTDMSIILDLPLRKLQRKITPLRALLDIEKGETIKTFFENYEITLPS